MVFESTLAPTTNSPESKFCIVENELLPPVATFTLITFPSSLNSNIIPLFPLLVTSISSPFTVYSLSIYKFPVIYPTAIYVSSCFITLFKTSFPCVPKFKIQLIFPSSLYFVISASLLSAPLLNKFISSPVDVCSPSICNLPFICPTAICPPSSVATTELYRELLLASFDVYSINPLLLYIKVTFPNNSRFSPNVVCSLCIVTLADKYT